MARILESYRDLHIIRGDGSRLLIAQRFLFPSGSGASSLPIHRLLLFFFLDLRASYLPLLRTRPAPWLAESTPIAQSKQSAKARFVTAKQRISTMLRLVSACETQISSAKPGAKVAQEPWDMPTFPGQDLALRTELAHEWARDCDLLNGLRHRIFFSFADGVSSPLSSLFPLTHHSASVFYPQSEQLFTYILFPHPPTNRHARLIANITPGFLAAQELAPKKTGQRGHFIFNFWRVKKEKKKNLEF